MDVTKSSENPDSERSEIREELRNMSFEELMKLKEELGSKVYNEAVFGVDTNKKKTTNESYKRENKNRPREMSAKRPVPLISHTVKRGVNLNSRDPRFDPKCGEYNLETFKHNYEFITDMRKNEIEELKKKLKQSTSEEASILKSQIQRLENQNHEEFRRRKREELIKEERESIRKAKEEGRQPYYPKKSERRAKELVQQFVELKEKGKLARHLEKRRKKNASKDRKKLEIS